MNDVDRRMILREEDAEPERFASWVNVHGGDSRHLEGNHEIVADTQQRADSTTLPRMEQVAGDASQRRSSVISSTSASMSDSSSAGGPEYAQTRNHNRMDQRYRRPTVTSMAGSGVGTSGILQRHPTERNPEAISRIETHRSQHAGTVGAQAVPSRLTKTLSRRKTGKPLSEMGANKPYPPPLPNREEYVVEFTGVDDPLHAQNWPMRKKLFISALVAYDSLAATMGSSIFSAAIGPTAQEFGVDREVTTLGTSLFVFGYAFGPLIWAPMSELYGRKYPLVISAFGFSVFSVAVAAGKDIQTILICRFFAGIFGSCPLSVTAAVYADIYNNTQRGLAVGVYCACVFMGPMLAPFIGGFITTSHLGWRWTEYISSIMGWLAFGLLLFFMEETYPPVILVGKAAELRRRTKNWGIHAKQEEIEVDMKELIIRNVSRPMRILWTEPIVLAITTYMAFVYGILYGFLTAYALVFEGKYGWEPGVAGLAYFGMLVGELIGLVVTVSMNGSYAKKLMANNNIPVPEWRLPLAMAGAPIFAAGLFWFGWSGYTGRVLWVAPVLSGLFTGFGIFAIFLPLLNYIVDAYLLFAASAIAGNTFLRSIFGGVFPLFATYMFDNMGIEWATTLLGCVAALAIPIPFLFYKYGKRLRAKSSFSPAPDIAQEKRRDEEAKLAAEGGSAVSEPVEKEAEEGQREGDVIANGHAGKQRTD